LWLHLRRIGAGGGCSCFPPESGDRTLPERDEARWEMNDAVRLCEAIRPGHPAVVTVCCLILLLVAASIWLGWARRPIPPPRGRLTVKDLQVRLEYEVQAEIEDARLAEFRRDGELVRRP
jgi:hypothetical protein